MDFSQLRKEYESGGIDASSVSADPFVQFRGWMEEATRHCPGKWFEPNAMSLATCDSGGRVTNRWVLLKGITDEGFNFYTNYESTKAGQLAANPNAALAFHWPYLGRQLRIEGGTEKTSRSDSREYFHSRPRGSQLGAVVSQQSAAIDSRARLVARVSELEAELDGGEVPLPDNWGGYLLRPVRFEFWQGRLDRLHDRIVYARTGPGEWQIERLAP